MRFLKYLIWSKVPNWPTMTGWVLGWRIFQVNLRRRSGGVAAGSAAATAKRSVYKTEAAY
jgi:hypothetical protein